MRPSCYKKAPSSGLRPPPQRVILATIALDPQITQKPRHTARYIFFGITPALRTFLQSLTPDHHAAHKKGSVVLEKYKIVLKIGEGANGITYEAVDMSSGAQVAVKELKLSALRNWKQYELFEREAATLRSLSHPNIPAYLDYGDDGAGELLLVQELADGPNLAQLLRQGLRLDEAEVERIARSLLAVLQYLSSRRCALRGPVQEPAAAACMLRQLMPHVWHLCCSWWRHATASRSSLHDGTVKPAAWARATTQGAPAGLRCWLCCGIPPVSRRRSLRRPSASRHACCEHAPLGRTAQDAASRRPVMAPRTYHNNTHLEERTANLKEGWPRCVHTCIQP